MKVFSKLNNKYHSLYYILGHFGIAVYAYKKIVWQ